jgi:hypothetical protein
MIVSQIGYTYLSNEAPATRDALINALDALITYSPESSTFVTAACWMDDVKKRGIYQFSDWHFINVPICDDTNNTLCESISTADIFAGKDNVVWAVNEAVSTIKSKYAGGFERGFALRNLIHLVGDIHQPLHCVNRFAPETPRGDAGGNLFYIQNYQTATNLHALWDSGIGLLDNNITRPLSASHKLYIETMANQIIAQLNTSQIANGTNITAWVMEGVNLSDQYVYDLPFRSYPSAEYVAAAQPVVLHQIGVAGYRLAQLLKEIVLCSAPLNNCPTSTVTPTPPVIETENYYGYAVGSAAVAAALIVVIGVLLYQHRRVHRAYSRVRDTS